MKIVKLDIETRNVDPNPNPKRDALQALPGSGSVTVRVEAEDGSIGQGGASFGRIASGPDALAALTIAIASSSVAAIGFSQKTCFPASRAVTVGSLCA